MKKEGCNGTVHNLITLNIPINLKRLLHCTVHIHDTTPCHSIEGRPFLGGREGVWARYGHARFWVNEEIWARSLITPKKKKKKKKKKRKKKQKKKKTKKNAFYLEYSSI